MKKQVQKGFTLIELMIVVAIIGILASIALPAYQDYIAKTQVQEPVTQASGVKKKVQEFFEKEGACPANATVVAGDTVDNYGIAAKADLRGNYYASMETAGTAAAAGGCTIVSTFRATGININLQGKLITWELYDEDKNAPKWGCHTDAGSAAFKFMPKDCRYSDLATAKAGI